MKQEARDRIKKQRNQDYAFGMKNAPRLSESSHWVQLVPAWLFTAVVIILTRMYSYTSAGEGTYWSTDQGESMEFFSHYKAVLIGFCLIAVTIVIIYRLCALTFYVQKTLIYIPLAIYFVLTILSTIFSEYPSIAWNGYDERFEGCFVMLGYFVLFFYIINSLRTEKDFKWILYPLAASSILLSLLGISQFTDHDFFRTIIGQKSILPSAAWPSVDAAAAEGEKLLEFTFMNREIYQTVYNINYVGFYLMLLIPLWMMMTIWAKKIRVKIFWGIVFGINFLNMIGAASGAGIIGLFVEIVIALVVLNKKLLRWWKSLLFIFVIAGIVMSLSDDFWLPEMKGAVGTLTSAFSSSEDEEGKNGGSIISTGENSGEVRIDNSGQSSPEMWSHEYGYIRSEGDEISFQIDSAPGIVATISKTKKYDAEMKKKEDKIDINKAYVVTAKTSTGQAVEMKYNKEYMEWGFVYKVKEKVREEVTASATKATSAAAESNDKKEYKWVTKTKEPLKNVKIVLQRNEEKIYASLNTIDDGMSWSFLFEEEKGFIFQNPFGNSVDPIKAPMLKIFEGREDFISGRGYIWGKSIPLIKKTIFLGHGPDTYIMYFPHNDYVGKYNSRWNLYMIVDKPHSMYIGMAVNTGLLSMIAFIAMFLIYFFQSFLLYFRSRINDLVSFVGAGLFIGTSGFMVAGISNDSTVSVMPIFYGLFATGIAANLIVRRRRVAEKAELAASGTTFKEKFKSEWVAENIENKRNALLRRERREKAREARKFSDIKLPKKIGYAISDFFLLTIPKKLPKKNSKKDKNGKQNPDFGKDEK